MMVIVARPGRAALTALGTVLGVAAFVTVLGLTATAGGQISRRFTILAATEVIVEQVSIDDQAPGNAFPKDAEARVKRLNGVREAGVWWPVKLDRTLPVTGVVLPGSEPAPDTAVIAASPGLLTALGPTFRTGRTFDSWHDSRGEHVAVLGSAVAARLGVTDLRGEPAVFVDGVPFTVIGVLDDVTRQPELLFSVFVPQHTAEALWGTPDSSSQAKMLIATELGAASVVGSEVALALRPDTPQLFRVITPPDPRTLQDQVSSDLAALFLILAGVCLVIGAVGIANTTMVGVLERMSEIGLRRAIGARRWHIAAQFLTESGVLGIAAGIVGSGVGVAAVVGVAVARQWTPILAPETVLFAPLIGAAVGIAAGAYPAWRATRIEPVDALRR